MPKEDRQVLGSIQSCIREKYGNQHQLLGEHPADNYFLNRPCKFTERPKLAIKYVRLLTSEDEWDGRNGRLTKEDYLALTDQDKLTLERLHAIKCDWLRIATMKYIPNTSDSDPNMSPIDIEHQQQTLKLFHGEKSAYDRYYLVGEIIHYHRQHYLDEIVSDDVLTCFYQEFFPKKINDPHDNLDAQSTYEQPESKNGLDEVPIEPLS